MLCHNSSLSKLGDKAVKFKKTILLLDNDSEGRRLVERSTQETLQGRVPIDLTYQRGLLPASKGRIRHIPGISTPYSDEIARASLRFMVFDLSGRVVSTAQKEHEPQIYPKPGWVEHNPVEIWTRTQEVIAEAMKAKGLRPADLAGIGITNQRETTVVWDRKTGKAVYNAIVWQDTRTADYVAEFSKNGGQDRYRAKTGLPLATYFSGLKVRWILQNIEALSFSRMGLARSKVSGLPPHIR